jgi:FkbM family methyltransferase
MEEFIKMKKTIKNINLFLRKKISLKKNLFFYFLYHLNQYFLYLSVFGLSEGSKIYFKFKFFLFIKLFSKKERIIKITNRKKFKEPLFLRNNITDFYIFEEIYIDEPFKSLDFTPKIIIDLGANIGLSTIYFKNRFPKSKVFSVEPEEKNFVMLLKNTSNYNNIFIFKKGIWSKKANLKIINKNSNSSAFIVKETSKKKTLEGISLNDLCHKYKISKIDLLKIDIEGTEKEILSKNYEWLGKTKFIFIESHERFSPGINKLIEKKSNEFSFTLDKKKHNYFVMKKK